MLCSRVRYIFVYLLLIIRVAEATDDRGVDSLRGQQPTSIDCSATPNEPDCQQAVFHEAKGVSESPRRRRRLTHDTVWNKLTQDIGQEQLGKSVDIQTECKFRGAV